MVSTNPADLTTDYTQTGNENPTNGFNTTVTEGTVSYTWSELLSGGTTYYWEVHALGPNYGYWSNENSFTTGTPTVTGVNPPEPPAVNGENNFTIDGYDFDGSAYVTLIDNGGGEHVLSGSRIISQTSTEITINPNFTTAGAGTWQVQVEDGSGVSSNWYSFEVVPAAASYTTGADFNADGGSADWGQETSGGLSFVFVKAAQGDNPNSFLPSNISSAPAVSSAFTFGVYDFADPDEYADPATQVTDPANSAQVTADAQAAANAFYGIAQSTLTSGHLLPALDVEDEQGMGGFNSPYDSGSTYPKWTWGEIAQWIAAWTTQLQQDDPALSAPILYMTQGYAENLSPQLIDSFLSSPVSYSLWIADTNSPGNVDPGPSIGSWGNWAVEQYDQSEPTPPGNLDALNPEVDLDNLEISENLPETPTLLILANLSGNVYSSESDFDGFTPIGVANTDPNNLGYAAVAYESPDHTNVVIAFRGTVFPPTSQVEWLQFTKDVAADVSFGGSVASPFLISEVTDAATFTSEVRHEFPGAVITLTGHSLGGALAQLIGKASGLPAYGFNAPGAGQLFEPLILSGAFAPLGAIATEAVTNDNYRLYGDQISLFGTATGSTVTLKDPSNITFDALPNAVADLMLNLDTYLVDLHPVSTVIDQIANGAQVSSSAGPDDAQTLENYINPLTSKSLDGIAVYSFGFVASNVVGALMDPSEGSDFLLEEQPGSPTFVSLDLPVLSGIASYNVRYETGIAWSSFEPLQPGVLDAFADDVDGLEFIPVDSSGQGVDISGSFLFGLNFTTSGTFSGTLATAATSASTPAWIAEGPNAQFNFTGSVGAQTLEVTAGIIYLTADLSADYPNYTLTIENGARVVLLSDQTLGGLNLTGGGMLDLENNEVILNYGSASDPKTSILQDLSSGCNGGAWNGPGIVSIDAEFSGGKYGIGFADGADGVLSGLASGQIELKYTLNGDANLDGVVNGADFSLLASNFGRAAPNGWDEGDFNYDGVVNGSDFSELAANFGQGANLNPPGIVPAAGALYSISGAPGAQLLDILSGTVTLSSDLSDLLPNYTLQVESGASVVLDSDQHLGAIQLNGSGTLDVMNHTVWIGYGSGSDPASTIAGYIKSGYNNGGWNGAGIISSTARTPTNGHAYGVGWADGNDRVVAGLSSGQIELKYTLVGDANLDGVVNGADFSILAANFGQGYTNWDQGNFLYGPAINGADFSALAANFGQGDSGASSASAAIVKSASNVSVAASTTAQKSVAPAFEAAVVTPPATVAASTPPIDKKDAKFLAKR